MGALPPVTSAQSPRSDQGMALCVRLFGGLQLQIGQRTIPETAWRSRKARQLVALLALAPDQRLHQEQVAETLWPDLGPEAARNNLRYTVHVARKFLATPPLTGQQLLPLQGEHLALYPHGPRQIDSLTFEAAAVAAQRSGDLAAHLATLALYTGDLLPDDRYEDWAAGRREALRDLAQQLRLTIARLHAAQGDTRAAIATLNQVLTADPTHEEAHTDLMRLYALRGERHQALRQYGQLRETLRRELDVAPDPVSTHLYDDILTRRFPATTPAAAPSTAPTAAPHHNLPLALTSFVGRAREVQAVRAFLTNAATPGRSTARLVTLIGAGGVGKTRLSLAVAQTLLAEYPDGVWFVELAPLTDPALVPGAVATVFGIRESAQQPTSASLIASLRQRTLLLLLDNCEHLIEAAAQLATALLTACPNVRLLASSREALRIPGELAWRVPSLTLPDQSPTGPTTPTTSLTNTEAVQLFLERARFARPGFALTSANATAIAEICRRLDGLPLALELAAARVATLAPDQLAARLDHSLRVLTGGARSGPSRQQTLRATLDWSYALLTTAERTLLRRLAIFVGSFTLDAAEALCADADNTHISAFETLTSLVDKSLVTVELHDTESRYRLLETVRQYATEHLNADPREGAHLRERHASYFLACAEEGTLALHGPAQVRWLTRFENDHDNFRAALHFFLDRGHADVERGLRLAAALGEFWVERGYLREGDRWLQRALAQGGEDSQVRALTFYEQGLVARYLGDLARAREAGTRSLAISQALDDPLGSARALNLLSITSYNLGEYDTAMTHAAAGLQLVRNLPPSIIVSDLLSNLANAVREHGDYEGDAALGEEALVIDRALGAPLEIARGLHQSAVACIDRGDNARARALLLECLPTLREGGQISVLSLALGNLGFVEYRLGNYQVAAATCGEGLALAHRIGSFRELALCLIIMALIVRAQGQLTRAVRLFSANDALRAARNHPLTPAERAAAGTALDLAPLRAALGDDAFTTAWQAGQAFTLDEAVVEALAGLEA